MGVAFLSKSNLELLCDTPFGGLFFVGMNYYCLFIVEVSDAQISSEFDKGCRFF